MARSVLTTADTDENGSPTVSQLLSALGKNDRSKQALSTLFADADGDGSVTTDDLQRALKTRFESLSLYGPSGALSPTHGLRVSATT